MSHGLASLYDHGSWWVWALVEAHPIWWFPGLQVNARVASSPDVMSVGGGTKGRQVRVQCAPS